MQIILQENSYGIPCDKLEVVLFRTVSESEAPPLDPFAMLVVKYAWRLAVRPISIVFSRRLFSLMFAYFDDDI